MRFFHDRCDCLGAQPRFMAYTELGGGRLILNLNLFDCFCRKYVKIIL